MKIIKITESQYKRLVRSKKILSEQVVYKDPKDEMDIHSQMFRILDSVGYRLKTIFKKPLYILKIEEGIVYVDKSEYQQNEIDYIKSAFEKLVRTGISSQDKMLTGSDDLGFDSGQNGDYVWPDEEDNDDVADVDDNDDVPKSDSSWYFRKQTTLHWFNQADTVYFKDSKISVSGIIYERFNNNNNVNICAEYVDGVENGFFKVY